MIVNALTIDVEDYFQVHALSDVIKYEDWDHIPSLVEKNTYKILDILDSQQSAVSSQQSAVSQRRIFTPCNAEPISQGEVSQFHPRLPPACQRHGRRTTGMSADTAIAGRSPGTGGQEETEKKSVKSCLPRLPCSSGRWYWGRWEPSYRGKSCLTQTVSSNQPVLFEFPMSTVRFLGRNLPCSGGGYFRLFPYPIVRLGLERINREGKPFIFYIHPWELDPDIPVVNNLSPLSRFRTYVNINKTESRFKKLISQFKFSTIKSSLTEK